MSKQPIKENEFFPAPGGSNGTVNYQTGYGTPSSPDISQNPNHFEHSDNNKAVNQNSNVAQDAQSGSMQAGVDALYAGKKETPTPDEVVTGIKYELGQQIKKDKRKAKETVLANLRKDPKFYSGLKMLGIDDKSMVDNMTENNEKNCPHCKRPLKLAVGSSGAKYRCSTCGEKIDDKVVERPKLTNESRHPNDAPARPKVTPNVEETKKIFAEMMNGRDQKYVVNSGIVDVMKQMWEQKRARRLGAK